MTCRLLALCLDAADPPGLATFWAGLLGWRPDTETAAGMALLPTDDTGFRIRFLPSAQRKTGQNRMHFDLTSQSASEQQQTVARALDLGARHLDIGQGQDAPHAVLADPEGNEFCVIEAGNRFLADCGFVGALACEGSRQVGYFWSQALGWPLVWDQDQETAIRSPHGGPKITWGGPPLPAKTGRNRVHFDLIPGAAGEHQAEIDRLISVGARLAGNDRSDIGRHEFGNVLLVDPDGNEFCLVPPGSSPTGS